MEPTLNAVVTVILGERVVPPPQYKDHARVHFVQAADFTPSDVYKCFQPVPSKVIITQPLPHRFYIALGIELRKRHIDPLYKPTSHDVGRTLDQLFGRLVRPPGDEPPPTPPPAEEIAAVPVEPRASEAPADVPTPIQNQETNDLMAKKKQAPRGALMAIVAEFDDRAVSVKDSAARILDLAGKRGLPSTLGSVLQQIRVARKRAGVPPAKAPAAAKAAKAPTAKGPSSKAPGRSAALAAIATIIAEMQRLRDEIERLEKENQALRARFEKAKALAETFSGI